MHPGKKSVTIVLYQLLWLMFFLIVLLVFKGNSTTNRLKNCNEMPSKLRALDRALRTIQPTSVEPERVFSSAGLFLTKLRTRTSDGTLDRMVFMKARLLKCDQRSQNCTRGPGSGSQRRIALFPHLSRLLDQSLVCQNNNLHNKMVLVD